MKYRRCEICRMKSERKDGQKRFFMANFPLDGDRCREWVKYTGNEDLVYIPIEKLHQLKHVCGNHFTEKDFKKKKTQLKKTAIPSLNLTKKPLSDDLLKEFPCHIFLSRESLTTTRNHAGKSQAKVVLKKTEFDFVPNAGDDDNVLDDEEIQNADDIIYEENLPEQANVDEVKGSTSESGLFSWNRKCDIVSAVGDNDNVFDEAVEDLGDVIIYEEIIYDQPTAVKSKGIDTQAESEKNEHVGFLCNCCEAQIFGYRYSCVECADYDLCGACEARAAHPRHYVLRIPGPRPHEEVQSMLQLIRRQLFQSDILLKWENTNKITPFTEESIKLETKDEEEEVDPFDVMAPATHSPLLERALVCGDTGQVNVNKNNVECTTNIPSNNLTIVTSLHNRQTDISSRRKLQDSYKVLTKDLPIGKVLSNTTLGVQQHFPPKRKAEGQITENYDIRLKDAKHPKVVLSRLPLESVNKRRLVESCELREDNVSNVATADEVKGDEESGSMITPEYLVISKKDIGKMFSVHVQDGNRIYFKIDKSKAQSRPPEPTITTPKRIQQN